MVVSFTLLFQTIDALTSSIKICVKINRQVLHKLKHLYNYDFLSNNRRALIRISRLNADLFNYTFSTEFSRIAGASYTDYTLISYRQLNFSRPVKCIANLSYMCVPNASEYNFTYVKLYDKYIVLCYVYQYGYERAIFYYIQKNLCVFVWQQISLYCIFQMPVVIDIRKRLNQFFLRIATRS